MGERGGVGGGGASAEAEKRFGTGKKLRERRKAGAKNKRFPLRLPLTFCVSHEGWRLDVSLVWKTVGGAPCKRGDGSDGCFQEPAKSFWMGKDQLVVCFSLFAVLPFRKLALLLLCCVLPLITKQQ